MLEKTQKGEGSHWREARFFYQHLIDERVRPSMNKPGAFGFYFSAFIGAARSVTWVMENEEKNKY